MGKELDRSTSLPVPCHSRGAALLQSVADWSTFALLVLAPLWMGGRHPVGRFVFAGLICLIAVTSLWHRVLIRERVWYVTGLEWLLLATFGVIGLQLMPLPHPWLSSISPTLSDRLPLWTSSSAANLGLGAWDCVSLHPDSTRVALAMFTAYALLFVITAQRIREAEDVGRIVRWVAGAAVLMAAVGLAQLILGNGKFLWVYAHPTREALRVVRGTFANQNHMAHLLALGIGPLVWWLSSYAVGRHRTRDCRHDSSVGGEDDAHRKNDRRAVLLVTALGLVLLAGVLTFSRAGVLAIVLASVLITGVLIWTGLLTRRGWIASSVLLLLLSAALSTHGVGPLADRFEALVGAESLAEVSAGRELIWSAVRKSIEDFPLLGTGLGTHVDVYPMFLQGYSAIEYPYAESGYLQVLEELGVVGLSLLLTAIGIVANWCRVALLRAATTELRLLAGAVTASLLISALHALVDFVWYIPACMTITVVLMACAWRLSRLACSTAPERSEVRVARPLLIAGSLGSCIVTMLIVTLCLGPARAARHWDEVARMTQWEKRQAGDGGVAMVDRMCECLEEAVRVSPRDARGHARLAAVYLQQFEVAQQHAANALSLTQIRDAALASEFPSLKAQDDWLDRAVPENRHLLDKAFRHSRLAVRLAPLRGEAYVYLAQLGFLAGDGSRAKRAYLDQALRVRPYDNDVLMVVGSELALDGQIEQATVYWRQVFDRAPHYREPIIELFAAQVPADEFLKRFRPDRDGAKQLFDHYRKIGFAPQASVAGRYYITRLAEQLQRDPAGLDADQWYQAFVVQDYLGDGPAALSCLRNAVVQTPDRFVYRQKLARQLLRQNHYDEAQEHLRWCLQRKPHDESLLRDLQTATISHADQTIVR